MLVMGDQKGNVTLWDLSNDQHMTLVSMSILRVGVGGGVGGGGVMGNDVLSVASNM